MKFVAFWFKFHWHFFHKDPIYNTPALVQIMAWHLQAIICTYDGLQVTNAYVLGLDELILDLGPILLVIFHNLGQSWWQFWFPLI